MDCQQLMVYGLLLLVAIYVLKDVCGFNIPMSGNNNEGFSLLGEPDVPSAVGVSASEEGRNERYLPVSGITTQPTSCYPQNTLGPDDLLPSGSSKQIQDFNNTYPTGEGILKGVNFLDAGFHVGVNTIGQSLRNANRGLRAEPPNPQGKVSPWSNSTIGPDLSRNPLNDVSSCAPVSDNSSIPSPNSIDIVEGMYASNGKEMKGMDM